MRAARETIRLLLAAWLGAALLFATSVAPAAFAVLPSRALAGLVVGRVLPVIFLSGALLSVADLVAEQRYVRPRSPWRRTRLALAALAAASCLFAQLVIGRWIHALRERIGPDLDALAPTDPLRVAFGELHAASVVLLGMAMLAIALSLALDVRRALAAKTGRD